MPVRAVRKNGKIIGYQWGETGKIYKTKAEAEEQGRAIRAAQAARAKMKKAIMSIVERWGNGRN